MIEHLQDLDEVKRMACEMAAELGALSVHNTAGERVIHDSEAVARFLKENEHVLAARVKREVKNKLATGLKNPKIRKAVSG